MKILNKCIVICSIMSLFFTSFGMYNNSEQKKFSEIDFRQHPEGRYLFGFIGEKLVIFDKTKRALKTVITNKPISKIYTRDLDSQDHLILVSEDQVKAISFEDKEFLGIVGLSCDIQASYVALDEQHEGMVKQITIKKEDDGHLSCHNYSLEKLKFLRSSSGEYIAFCPLGAQEVYIFKAADNTFVRQIVFDYLKPRGSLKDIRFSSDGKAIVINIGNKDFSFCIERVRSFLRKKKEFYICDCLHRKNDWCGACFSTTNGLGRHKIIHKSKEESIISPPLPPQLEVNHSYQTPHPAPREPLVRGIFPPGQFTAMKGSESFIPNLFNSMTSGSGNTSSESPRRLVREPFCPVNTFVLDNFPANMFGTSGSQLENQRTPSQEERMPLVLPIKEKHRKSKGVRRKKKRSQFVVPVLQKVLQNSVVTSGKDNVDIQKDILRDQVNKKTIEYEEEVLVDEEVQEEEDIKVDQEFVGHLLEFTYSPNGYYLAGSLLDDEMLLVFDRKKEEYHQFLFPQNKIEDFCFMGMRDFYGMLIKLEDGSYRMINLFSWKIIPTSKMPKGLDENAPLVKQDRMANDFKFLESPDRTCLVGLLGNKTYVVLDKDSRNIKRQLVIGSYRGRSKKSEWEVSFSEDSKYFTVKCPYTNKNKEAKKYVFCLDDKDLDSNCCMESNEHEYVCSRYFDSLRSLRGHKASHGRRILEGRKKKEKSSEPYVFTEDDAVLTLMQLFEEGGRRRHQEVKKTEKSDDWKKKRKKRKKKRKSYEGRDAVEKKKKRKKRKKTI